MLVAQALGEYGAGSAIAGAIDSGYALVDRVRDADPSTWAMMALGAFLVWFFVGRMRN
jgi:hypothetical protein